MEKAQSTTAVVSIMAVGPILLTVRTLRAESILTIALPATIMSANLTEQISLVKTASAQIQLFGAEAESRELFKQIAIAPLIWTIFYKAENNLILPRLKQSKIPFVRKAVPVFLKPELMGSASKSPFFKERPCLNHSRRR